MILFSFLLVVVAAVTLIAGFFQDGLTLIWISMAAAGVAALVLVVGLLARRRAEGGDTARPEPLGVTGGRAAATRPAPLGSRADADDEGEAGDGEAAPDEVEEPVVVEDEAAVTVSSAPAAEAAEAAEEAEAEEAEAEAEVPEEAPSPRRVVRRSMKPAAPVATDEPVAAPEPAVVPEPEPEPELEPEPEPEPVVQPAAAAATGERKVVRRVVRKTAPAGQAVGTRVVVGEDGTRRVVRTVRRARTTGAAAMAKLVDVDGIGEVKGTALLENYGSLEAIGRAPVDELASTASISTEVAETLRSRFGA